MSDSAVAKFKEVIPSVLNSLPFHNITENSYVNFGPSRIDYLVNCAVGSMRAALNSNSPLKNKIIKHRSLAPWFNSQTHMLKHQHENLKGYSALLNWNNPI